MSLKVVDIYLHFGVYLLITFFVPIVPIVPIDTSRKGHLNLSVQFLSKAQNRMVNLPEYACVRKVLSFPFLFPLTDFHERLNFLAHNLF